LLDRLPRALSGGQRQRVAMGRAIVRRPQLFLFDEPLSNLDAALRAQVRVDIRKQHEQLGATSIYVTHDQVEAMTLADRMFVLNKGQVEQSGTPREVYDAPAPASSPASSAAPR
jgi:ABC-type sugar transport system ATPase subunit